MLLPAAVRAADFTIPPVPTRFVTDNANALSSDTVESVDTELHTYQRATGHQVIVWIGQSTGDVPLEDWTGDAARKWRVGRKGFDDGAILFLFMKDHHVRIEVGYGLESSLTDADASQIIRDQIVPRMKAGDPDGAVKNGAAAMIKTITPSYNGVAAPSEEAPNAPWWIYLIFGFAGLMLLGGLIVFVLRVIGQMMYGVLVMTEGKSKAQARMKSLPALGGESTYSSSSSSSSDDSFSSSSDDDFSSGGGDFGGGGASGSW